MISTELVFALLCMVLFASFSFAVLNSLGEKSSAGFDAVLLREKFSACAITLNFFYSSQGGFFSSNPCDSFSDGFFENGFPVVAEIYFSDSNSVVVSTVNHYG